MFGEMRNKETIDVPTAEGVIKESLADYITRLKQERDDLQERKDKYYQQTLDDAITISDLVTECNELKQENEKIIKDYEEAYTKQIEYADDVIKLTQALEEIRDMLFVCKDECCCEKCKYCDECEEVDALFPDVNETILKKINEVLK